MFLTKVVEKIKTSHFNFNFFFPPKFCLYQIMWENTAWSQDRPQKTIWRTRYTCWITKSTGTHSKYVILIAFRRQYCWSERASMLRLYLYCPTCFDVTSVAPAIQINTTLSLSLSLSLSNFDLALHRTTIPISFWFKIWVEGFAVPGVEPETFWRL